MAGRPRGFDVDGARDVAMHLFWTQGFEATSLSELISVMELSKSSFYQTFKSKHALFEQCLERYREVIVDGMSEGLSEAPSAIEFIHAALTQVADETAGPMRRRGCLLMNTAAEFAQRDPNIARSVKVGVRAMLEVFTRAIVAAQVAGDIDSKARPAALADYLVTNIIGLKTQVKAGASRQQIVTIAELSFTALPRMI